MNVDKLLTEVSAAVAESRSASRRRTDTLLQDVFRRIATFREAKRRFADELAPDFSLFDYLRTDEIGLSRCLADLLDPLACDKHGKHGQGGLFLNTLVAHLSSSLNHSKVGEWATTSDCQSVTLEHQTDRGRRIDILIQFSNGGLIGIENKPWAGDQANQLKDYADYLAKKSINGQWLLVYLSDREPELGSIDEKTRKKHEDSGHFLRFSYQEAEAWLQEATEKTRSIKVRLFVEDLMKFIRTQVRGDADMSETREVTQQILSNKENLESSFLIAKSLQNVKHELLGRLQNCLENKLSEKHFVLEFDLRSMRSGEIYTGFCIRFQELSTDDGRLCFEFCGVNLKNLAWGIALHKDKCSADNQAKIHETMNQSFGDGKQNNNWLWFQTIDNQWGPGFRNWYDSEKPWLAIYDCDQEGSLANRILDLAERTQSVFGSNLDLLKANSVTNTIAGASFDGS